jgi:chromosome partitioning protein
VTRLNRPYAFVLNQCPVGRTTRPADASRALSLLGVLALPFIAQRTDHQDAIGLGLGVTELDRAGKAAEEINALWGWVKRRIEGATSGKTAAVA